MGLSPSLGERGTQGLERVGIITQTVHQRRPSEKLDVEVACRPRERPDPRELRRRLGDEPLGKYLAPLGQHRSGLTNGDAEFVEELGIGVVGGARQVELDHRCEVGERAAEGLERRRPEVQAEGRASRCREGDLGGRAGELDEVVADRVSAVGPQQLDRASRVLLGARPDQLHDVLGHRLADVAGHPRSGRQQYFGCRCSFGASANRSGPLCLDHDHREQRSNADDRCEVVADVAARQLGDEPRNSGDLTRRRDRAVRVQREFGGPVDSCHLGPMAAAMQAPVEGVQDGDRRLHRGVDDEAARRERFEDRAEVLRRDCEC